MLIFFLILSTIKIKFVQILVWCMANILICFWHNAGDWKLVPGPFMILLKSLRDLVIFNS